MLRKSESLKKRRRRRSACYTHTCVHSNQGVVIGGLRRERFSLLYLFIYSQNNAIAQAWRALEWNGKFRFTAETSFTLYNTNKRLREHTHKKFKLFGREKIRRCETVNREKKKLALRKIE